MYHCHPFRGSRSDCHKAVGNGQLRQEKEAASQQVSLVLHTYYRITFLFTSCVYCTITSKHRSGSFHDRHLLFADVFHYANNYNDYLKLEWILQCECVWCVSRYRLSGGGDSSSEEEQVYDKRERDLFGAKASDASEPCTVCTISFSV